MRLTRNQVLGIAVAGVVAFVGGWMLAVGSWQIWKHDWKAVSSKAAASSGGVAMAGPQSRPNNGPSVTGGVTQCISNATPMCGRR